MDLPHCCQRGDLTDYGSWWPSKTGKWFVTHYLCSSEYASSYSRSNTRVFAKDFADGEDVWWRWSGDSIAIRTLAYRNAKTVREAIDALENYPILDESDHSDLENEEEHEDWESWARDDFRRELVRVVKENWGLVDREKDDNGFDADDVIDRLSDEQINTLFYELCRQEEQYPEHTGSECIFPLADLADIWGGSPSVRGIVPGTVPGFSEDGLIRYHAGEIVDAWYPAFAINPRCPRCDDEKPLGVCREHVDCLQCFDLSVVCPNALKTHASCWEHACLDPECAAVLEHRATVEAAVRAAEPQLSLFDY